MSIRPTRAPIMNAENSVIKHYKKQLIHRQHDEPNNNNSSNSNNNNNNSRFEEVTNTKIYDLEGEKKKVVDQKAKKKVRRKRKNKNCRGQFRHEGMELIKLGTNQSHSLCKTKEPYSARLEKPPEPRREAPPGVNQSSASVIQSTRRQPILEIPLSRPPYVHPLPQMVPERRNSRELQPRAPVIYRSPPQPLQPEYRISHHLPTYAHPLPYRPTPILPPPPYPVPRSPPRPVPRPHAPPHSHPLPRPQPVSYPKAHFPFPERLRTPDFSTPPEAPRLTESPERKKGKVDEKVVAAIDLTVETRNADKRHKCQCECGKSFGEPVAQEVIISLKEKDNSVPSTYLKGKMVNGVLRFEPNGEDSNRAENGGATSPVKEKLPPLFRIDDLLANGVRLEQKRPKIAEKRDSPVIVGPAKLAGAAKPKPKDHSVSRLLSRKQSTDVDTLSISSSGSEPTTSPKGPSFDKQVPHGKLFYYQNNNSFIRYFDDTQKKLFIDNITSDGESDKTIEEKEIIELPKDTNFNGKDYLTVEEYVSEMTVVEKYIPKDFFNFYKFVTGYQIYNNNLPVSFLTFLKVYNTNGLKILLEKYVQSLKPNGEASN